jgi:hypothetical protein
VELDDDDDDDEDEDNRLFNKFITIPYYEWDEVEGEREKEEEYLKGKLSEGMKK